MQDSQGRELREAIRVAKCHEYDEYIRVKIFAGWGKSLGEDAIWSNLAFFGKICTIMQDFRV